MDSIQTIFSLEPIRRKLVALELPPTSLEILFASTVRDGMALTLSGEFKPFLEVAASQLEILLSQHSVDPSPSNIREVMSAFSELTVYPDVVPALTALKDSGIRIVIITNGGKNTTEKLVEKHGLNEFIEKIYSIDEVKMWKPYGTIYRHAATDMNKDLFDIGLIAVHSWDIHGAAKVGYVTGWVSRLEGRFAPAFGKPDVAGENVTDVVEALLDLPVQKAAERRQSV